MEALAHEWEDVITFAGRGTLFGSVLFLFLQPHVPAVWR